MSAALRRTVFNCGKHVRSRPIYLLQKQHAYRFSTSVNGQVDSLLWTGRVLRLLHPVSTNVQIQSIRCVSGFFNKANAQQLWDGVSSVSNAGKKKGRGRAVGRKKVSDLNRGQKLGDGRDNMVWPGLNAPIIKERQILRHCQLGKDPTRRNKLVEMREKLSVIKYPATPPLLRGFTGGRMVGMRYGTPDPIGDYTFDGFDSVLLELKHVSNMTGTLGRKMHYTAFVIVGNKNGVAGHGYGKGTKLASAIKVAQNRAAQALYYIPLFDGHTVFHNMFSQYHKSKLFIHKKEKGYGLKCHRALMAVCKMIGLRDLHCKVEGNTTNIKAITKGLLNALVDQETHQDLADRTGYHVVERRRERDDFPVLVASPVNGIVRTDSCNEDRENISFDLNRLYLDGKVEYKRPVKSPFLGLKSYRKAMAKKHKRRNMYELQIQRKAGLIP